MSTMSEKRAARKAEKRIEREEAEAGFRLNKIKPVTNGLFNALFAVLSFVCIFPFFFVLMISISSETSLRTNGYALIPSEFSLAAYEFLWNERDMILRSLLVSIGVTVLGTVIGVLLTTMMGYVLSRPQFKLRGFLQWVVFIPMIFTGGMVANYVVIANMLHMDDTIWCLVLPLAVSSWNVTISKTFFRQTIPDSIIESAKIDGASQLTIFARIVVPISKPVFATVALFLTFGYWNDWLQA
ncbi:MAG TPA: carbohydrate ABC transporter permease, partial [Candidatus Gemmiger faecigallinarum]|nr:carbohydrate ABC transporter permease [Candidatus Gemmiger faecigallinarum]